MEDQEIPLEGIQEEIQHKAEHEGDPLSSRVALTAAVLAVLAAITGLLSGHHANEAMIEQVRASDQWAFYQAKGIKATVLTAKRELLEGLGKKVKDNDLEKIKQYQEDQKDIQEQAKEKEDASIRHLRKHTTLAKGVTFFQVAIAIAAIAALTRKKHFWYVGLALGVGGSIFLALGSLG